MPTESSGPFAANAADRRPPWGDFVARLPARVRNCLRRKGIASWDALLSAAKVEGRFAGLAPAAVQPGAWRGFGVTSFDDLVRAMKAVGVDPPPHWVKGIK